MRALLFPALFVFMLTLPAANAEPCFGYGPEATGLWQITDGTAGGTFYVDDHGFVLGQGIWIWQEGNGVWTPKLAGVHHAEAWWMQDDLQIGGCGDLNVGLCKPPWLSCPELPYPHDIHVF